MEGTPPFMKENNDPSFLPIVKGISPGTIIAMWHLPGKRGLADIKERKQTLQWMKGHVV